MGSYFFFNATFSLKLGLIVIIGFSITACDSDRREARAERHMNLGIQNYYKNDKDEALKQLTRSIRISHNLQNAFAYKIKILLEADQIDEATKSAGKFMEMESRDLDIDFNVGMLFFEKEEYPTAINFFNLILEEDPYHQSALVNRGIAYFNIDKRDKSYEDLTFVIENLRSNTEVLVSRGVLFLYMERYELAKRDFSDALEFDKEDGEIYHYLGLTDLFMGNLESACQHFNQASQLMYFRSMEMYEKYCQ